jgi:hypothetical protein
MIFRDCFNLPKKYRTKINSVSNFTSTSLFPTRNKYRVNECKYLIRTQITCFEFTCSDKLMARMEEVESNESHSMI